MRRTRLESLDCPAHRVTPSVLVILACLLTAACASDLAPRPLSSGFAADAGVVDPYVDGKRHLADGHYELAVQRFGQALAHDRRSLDALNGLAIAYARLGRFESAQTQFERALQIDPTSAVTLNNYGWSLAQQGRLREARAFLELARRHAADADASVIAANLENLARARPPALVAALRDDASPARPDPHRLIRLDDNAYLLETTAEWAEPSLPPVGALDEPSAPSGWERDDAASGSSGQGEARLDPRSALSVAAQDVGAADGLPAPAEPSRAAAPEPDVPMKLHAGGAPIRLWPPRASGSEADPITAGDEK